MKKNTVFIVSLVVIITLVAMLSVAGGLQSKGMYVQCYDGFENQTQDYICSTSAYWLNQAEDTCQNRCNNVTGKCGVNSWSMRNFC